MNFFWLLAKFVEWLESLPIVGSAARLLGRLIWVGHPAYALCGFVSGCMLGAVILL